MNSKLKLAREAEKFAVDYLSLRGYQLLAKNFRRVGCEIDAFLLKEETLIVLEVKARRRFSNDMSEIENLLSSQKVNSLRKGCECFLVENPIFIDSIRFDLALVQLPMHSKNGIRIKHLENIIEI